jgi:hypothetical protein
VRARVAWLGMDPQEVFSLEESRKIVIVGRLVEGGLEMTTLGARNSSVAQTDVSVGCSADAPSSSCRAQTLGFALPSPELPWLDLVAFDDWSNDRGVAVAYLATVSGGKGVVPFAKVAFSPEQTMAECVRGLCARYRPSMDLLPIVIDPRHRQAPEPPRRWYFDYNSSPRKRRILDEVFEGLELRRPTSLALLRIGLVRTLRGLRGE